MLQIDRDALMTLIAKHRSAAADMAVCHAEHGFEEFLDELEAMAGLPNTSQL